MLPTKMDSEQAAAALEAFANAYKKQFTLDGSVPKLPAGSFKWKSSELRPRTFWWPWQMPSRLQCQKVGRCRTANRDLCWSHEVHKLTVWLCWIERSKPWVCLRRPTTWWWSLCTTSLRSLDGLTTRKTLATDFQCLSTRVQRFGVGKIIIRTFIYHLKPLWKWIINNSSQLIIFYWFRVRSLESFGVQSHWLYLINSFNNRVYWRPVSCTQTHWFICSVLQGTVK